METKVTTGKVRFSYCNIFQPRAAIEGGEPKYSVTLLVPKTDTETLKKIKNAIEAAKKAGESKLKDKNGKMPINVQTSVHDGDLPMPKSGDEYPEECKGCYVINTSSKNKPAVFDARGNEIFDATEVYSGCYGRAVINFYAYNTNGGKGVACGLNGIQKLSDGDSLGGIRVTAKDFDDGFEDNSEGVLL